MLALPNILKSSPWTPILAQPTRLKESPQPTSKVSYLSQYVRESSSEWRKVPFMFSHLSRLQVASASKSPETADRDSSPNTLHSLLSIILHSFRTLIHSKDWGHYSVTWQHPWVCQLLSIYAQRAGGFSHQHSSKCPLPVTESHSSKDDWQQKDQFTLWKILSLCARVSIWIFCYQKILLPKLFEKLSLKEWPAQKICLLCPFIQ